MFMDKQVDVIIMGGGLVGGALAVALAQQGLSCCVIDKTPLEAQCDPALDGRTTAVNYGASLFFKRLGIWDAMASTATPIQSIRAFEHQSPWAVNYNAADIGAEPLGYIVINHHIRKAIHQGLAHPLIHMHIAGDETPLIERGEHTACVRYKNSTFHARLLVGAEGRGSFSRGQTPIRTTTWDYGQMGLVVHMAHKEPHENRAWEVFTPTGTFAALPLQPCSVTGAHQSGTVWALPKGSPILNLDDESLALAIEEVFPYFGSIRIASKRWTYPLTALKVDRLIHTRYALVGDAAHGMHPIAGQGVNVGWQDAQVFSDVLSHAQKLGLDIGGLSTLQEYEKKRLPDHKAMLIAMDGLQRLFANNSRILHYVRNAGFAVVNNLPPLKKIFMRKAMGI
jgi:2-octaprenyl-6-methoxyphenol hydroxylase